MTIVPSLNRANIFFIFREDNTEVEISLNKNTFASIRHRLTDEEIKGLTEYFKFNKHKSKL